MEILDKKELTIKESIDRIKFLSKKNGGKRYIESVNMIIDKLNDMEEVKTEIKHNAT